MSAVRAASSTWRMCGVHPLASATALRRSHTLPPSEMKSLYGSITSRPVRLLSYFTPSTLLQCTAEHHRQNLVDQRLRAENDGEGEALGVFGVGLGGVDHDAQVVGRDDEGVAVQRDRANVGVVDDLATPE